MIYAGIDLGFGQLQATKDGKHFMNEPSVVGMPPLMDTGYDTSSGIALDYRGTMYYVGSKALSDTTDANYTFIADKTERDLNDMIKYLACLGTLQDIGSSDGFRVGTGLPVYEYATLKESLKKKLVGNWSYYLNGQPRWSSVVQVDVMPQGVGSYYDEVFTDDGEVDPVNKSVLDGRTLIIECGFRTTEVVTMEAGRFRGNPWSLTVEYGMSRIHHDIRMFLKKEGLSFRVPEIDDMVRSECYFVEGGRAICITPEVVKSAERAFAYILHEIQFAIPNYRRYYDHVIVSGGGTFNLFPFVQQEFGSIARMHRRADVVTGKAPDEANAAGYRKRVLFLANNGR